MAAVDLKPLAADFKPGRFDVICARGGLAANHPGNKWYRQMVKEHVDIYCRATSRSEKSQIVSSILHTVKKQSSDGGFVRKSSGRWYRVGDEFAREKIGQSFRNLLFTQCKSRAKTKKERLRRQAQDGPPHLPPFEVVPGSADSEQILFDPPKAMNSLAGITAEPTNPFSIEGELLPCIPIVNAPDDRYYIEAIGLPKCRLSENSKQDEKVAPNERCGTGADIWRKDWLSEHVNYDEKFVPMLSSCSRRRTWLENSAEKPMQANCLFCGPRGSDPSCLCNPSLLQRTPRDDKKRRSWQALDEFFGSNHFLSDEQEPKQSSWELLDGFVQTKQSDELSLL